MDIVTILRDLRRARLLVVVVALLAVVAGIAVSFKFSFPARLESRKYEVGRATARILVDTPRSQVVEVAPEGSDSLGVRANLLASLMVDGIVKTAIAKHANLPPEKLVVVSDAAIAAEPIETKPKPTDYVLTTRVVTNTGGDELPIIEVEAQAPDRAAASALGRAAVDGLRDYLDTKAATQQIPNADRLQVTGLGAPQAATVVRGRGPLLGVFVMIVVLGLGCGLILLFSAGRRGFREATERDRRDREGGEATAPVTPAPAPPAPAPASAEVAAPRPVAVPARPAARPRLVPKTPTPDTTSWFADPHPALVPSSEDDDTDARAESA